MARYTGPANKKSRRLGFSTLENGKDLARRPYAPGQHGKDHRRKLSEYGIQMQEKQKVRILYGLNEKQFRKTFDKASKMKGKAGENLLILLIVLSIINSSVAMAITGVLFSINEIVPCFNSPA